MGEIQEDLGREREGGREGEKLEGEGGGGEREKQGRREDRVKREGKVERENYHGRDLKTI